MGFWGLHREVRPFTGFKGAFWFWIEERGGSAVCTIVGPVITMVLSSRWMQKMTKTDTDEQLPGGFRGESVRDGIDLRSLYKS
jgi:hypothetical protein